MISVRSNRGRHIIVHSGPTAGDELHNSGHPPIIKALAEQDLPKEGPVNRVIGFMEVELQEDRAMVLGPDFVKDFVED